MVEQVTFQTVFQFLQTVGILVGVYYYIMTIRTNQRNQEISLKNQELTLQSQELTRKAQQMAIESRNAQFFIQLYDSMMDVESLKVSWKDMMIERDWSTFEEWWDKYGPENNIDVFIPWMKSMVVFEIFGVLLKRGFLSIELIDDIMSGTVLMMWDVYEPVFMGFRERFGWPQFQEHQEYLTNEIRKVVEQQHPDFEGRRIT